MRILSILLLILTIYLSIQTITFCKMLVEMNKIMIFFSLFIYIILFALIACTTTLAYRTLKGKVSRKMNIMKFSNEIMPLEFKKIYAELFKKHIVGLEKMRKKIISFTIFQIIYAIISSIIFVKLITNYKGNYYEFISEWFSIVLIGGFICSCLKRITLKNEYARVYKECIVSNLVKLVNKNLTYINTKKIDENVALLYRESRFDKNKYINVIADDYIDGIFDNDITIKIRDVSVFTYCDVANKKGIEELFKGIFACMQLKNNINSYIKIKSNMLKFSNYNNLIMDSIEFERIFDVETKDKILGMRILTADVMDLLVNFYNKYKLNFEIIIKNYKIYIRFLTGPMFEPQVFLSSLNRDVIFIYYLIIKFVIDVTQSISKALNELDI